MNVTNTILRSEEDLLKTSRFLRYWSLATLLCAVAVLVLGALITTFRVGMSDPVWPTEPWFLIVNNEVWVNEPAPGFLIEHTHRLVAWGIGVFATVLAISVWWSSSDRLLKRFGTFSILFLLVAYLALHGEMGAAWRARKSGGELHWPVLSAVPMLVGFILTITSIVLSFVRSDRQTWLRASTTAALVAVMIQGLLGGYRVFLDQLMGTQLAAIHGSFGQITFALLGVVFMLTLGSKTVFNNDSESSTASTLRGIRWLSIACLGAVVVQLIWGVWLRHVGAGMAQRLHIFFAFAVFAIGLLLIVRLLQSQTLRQSFGLAAYALLSIFAVQIYLGIEAYLGKFVVSGSEALLPVELRKVTTDAAVIRTTHTLLGAALLGFVAMLTAWLHRTSIRNRVQDADSELHELATGKDFEIHSRDLVAAR